MFDFMTVEEVAKYLRVTTKTIYRLLEKRSIPATKVGRQWRFDRDTTNHWLQQKSEKKAARILVIDDDESVCSLFKDTLEELGHLITTVMDSLEGLEAIRNGNYDIVFLDLKMPVMNGGELFKQIRTITPNLPVTIITGYPDSDLMMDALAYGPLGVMNKPFNGSDIQTAVENYLRFGLQNT